MQTHVGGVVYGIRLCLVNQGSQARFPASPSLSDETLSHGPSSSEWDALKPEPLPFEPSGAHGQKINHKPTRPVLFIAKEHGPQQ